MGPFHFSIRALASPRISRVLVAQSQTLPKPDVVEALLRRLKISCIISTQNDCRRL